MPTLGMFAGMNISDFLREQGLDEERFAALSGGAFSAEAVRKWRYGQRVPRPKHIAMIAELTGGKVTANDLVSAHARGAA